MTTTRLGPALIAAALLAPGLVACAGSGGSSAHLAEGGSTRAPGVVTTTAPTGPPDATVTNRVCLPPGPTTRPPVPRSGPLPTVDRAPSGVTIVWLPGMNMRPCRAELTHYGVAVARRLAREVDTSPRFPPGAFSCAMDDNSMADVYFSYPGSARAEYVRVSLRGCRDVTAPGDVARRASAALIADVDALRPPAWRRLP